jgi:hypothetical protein
MIKPVELVDLHCGCGRLISHSLPNSEHYCRGCDRWLVFVNGQIVRTEAPHLFIDRLKAGRNPINKEGSPFDYLSVR